MGAETIYQTVRRLVNREALSPRVAARRALENMTKAQLIEFVLPEIERLARSMDRNRVRSLEGRALTDSPLRATPSNPEAVAALVSECFLVPDRGMVSWGDATVADHLARAEWQRHSAQDLVADAERHEAAATLIRKRKVRCLSQIPGWSGMIDGEAAA